MSKSPAVEAFLKSLDHPQKPEILAVREIILAADKNIGEDIKWNAPSFCTTDHFATLNLRAKNGVVVVMHFGAKKSAISTEGVDIPDPKKLLEWMAKDRAVVTFKDLGELKARKSAFVALIREWIKHL